MKRSRAAMGIVLGTLVVAAVSGCAGGGKPTYSAGTGDVVADRQRLMKLIGANWQDAQNKLKAGNIEAIAVNAEAMAVSARHIAVLFPEGSLTDRSKAKPDIWHKWPEFTKAAMNFETTAEQLRDTARTKNAQATEAAMKDFGRTACGSCHTPFRVPPPRQG
jgi:cytochrome c556